jgi:hypothetical protein
MLMVVFIPFLIVLFIEFVLRLGMGPFAEEVSLVSGVFASLVAICSFVWIKKGIILGFIPIFAASILMVLLQGTMTVLRLRFFYFFASFLLLTFISILIYAMSKVSRKHGMSYGRSIALFFIGILIFIGGMGLIDFLFGFLNPELGMLQSLLRGIRSGLMLGSGVSIVVLLLSQRNT